MGRVRSASISQGLQFEEEDGIAPTVSKSRREKGQTFECALLFFFFLSLLEKPPADDRMADRPFFLQV